MFHRGPALVEDDYVCFFTRAREHGVEKSGAGVSLGVCQVLVPFALREHLQPLPRLCELSAAVMRDDDLAVRVVRGRVPDREHGFQGFHRSLWVALVRGDGEQDLERAGPLRVRVVFA